MNTLRLPLPLAYVFFALCSCVSPTVYDTAQKVTDATQVVRDDYNKTTWIKSPIIQYSNSFDRCFLRTLVADSGAQVDQLYVIYTPSDWAFLERANDSTGRNLEVTVINPTFAKVRLDPEKAELVTGQGKRLLSYAINRTDASGGVRNFEAHFLAQGVQTGDEQKLYLERMGKVRETIYHRDSPVFKGKTYSGRIAYAPLPPQTQKVELVLHDVITGFGIHDVAVDKVTLRFPFAVEQGTRIPPTAVVAERR